METTALETVQRTYDLFESLNLSVTGLLVLGAVLALGFLFAIREAASWFFKVDDLKRDVRRLQELVLAIEGEVRVLQNVMAQGREAQATAAAPTLGAEKKPEAKVAAGFPISH